jgi:hypothetical protein
MFARALVAGVLLFASAAANADQWITFTDGRTGGCMVSDGGFVYGCTPQPPRWTPYTDGRTGGCFVSETGNVTGCTEQETQSSAGQQGQRPIPAYQPQNREEYCQMARQQLKNAHSNFYRTMVSMREADESFSRTGCSK